MLSIRQKILEVAKELFFKNGYEKTSTNEIINLAGVSKGGFYHHFSSKEILLDEVISNIKSVQFGSLIKMFQSNKYNPKEKIKNRLDFELDYFLKNQEFYINLFSNPNLIYIKQKMMHKFKLLLYPEIVKITVEGNKKGLFAVQYPGETVILIVGLFETIIFINKDSILDKEIYINFIYSAKQIVEKFYGFN